MAYKRSHARDADLVIQSGAPVYWCHETGEHCHNNEWYKALVTKRYLKNKKKHKKLLNLAAGTCQKYHSDGSEFCPVCYDYMKGFHELADVTTVRDTLAKTVFSHVDISVPVMPCSSIFAIDECGLKNEGEGICCR